MGRIQISGRVEHRPESGFVPGGLMQNGSVELLDVDAGGGDDVIWSGSVGVDGRFSGLSGEWQDSKTIQVWIQDSLLPTPRGHWESRNVPDPADILLLKLRITQAGRVHEVFPFANTSLVPIVVPWASPSTITKDCRALVVVNNTVDLGRQDLKQLYQFIETSGDAVARAILSPYYKSITSLNGSKATTDGFCSALKAAGQIAGVQAVDAIINMHGDPGRLFFFEAGSSGVPVSSLQTRLEALGMKGKLRLAYNTSCFGDSHASAFLAGGFNAAIGSRQVTANSGSEYPVFLSLWASGMGLEPALAAAQTPPLREPMDAVARDMGFSQVDSFKVISGDKMLSIRSMG